MPTIPKNPPRLTTVDHLRAMLAAEMGLISDATACKRLGLEFDPSKNVNEFREVREQVRQSLAIDAERWATRSDV